MAAQLALFRELDRVTRALIQIGGKIASVPIGERRTFTLWDMSIPVVFCDSDVFGELNARDTEPATSDDHAISFYALWNCVEGLCDFLTSNKPICIRAHEITHRGRRVLGRLVGTLTERIETESKGALMIGCSEKNGLLTWTLNSRDALSTADACCPTCHRAF